MTTTNVSCLPAGAALLPASCLQHFALQVWEKPGRDLTGIVASLGKSEEAQEDALWLSLSPVTQQNCCNGTVQPCCQFVVSYQVWLFETPKLIKNGDVHAGWPAWLMLTNQQMEGTVWKDGGLRKAMLKEDQECEGMEQDKYSEKAVCCGVQDFIFLLLCCSGLSLCFGASRLLPSAKN